MKKYLEIPYAGDTFYIFYDEDSNCVRLHSWSPPMADCYIRIPTIEEVKLFRDLLNSYHKTKSANIISSYLEENGEWSEW